jgi:hypothetical protein
MDIFVNRVAELQLIDDAVGKLMLKQDLIRKPILEFWGINGIGKSSFLAQIKQKCLENELCYIWLDISKNTDDISQDIVKQVQKLFTRLQFASRSLTSTGHTSVTGLSASGALA